MDVKAILLIGTETADLDGTSALAAGAPLATVDILGRPLALRIVDRLIRHGVGAVHLVGQVDRLRNASQIPPQAHFVTANDANLWRECEDVFSEVAQSGAEVVLVQRVGGYLELDYDDLLGFHLDHRNRVTPVCAAGGETLDVFCISASRRNDAAFLFRHQLRESRTPSVAYTYRGYRNDMMGGADIRRLATAAFRGEVDLQPFGRQVRPGVWMGEGARIERGARVIAPAFIGAHTIICPSAVITRFSNVEQHSMIDCGTVIEDASIMPFTYIGAGLDVAHAVAGNGRLLNLPRNVEIEIADPKLMRVFSQHAPVRALATLAMRGPRRLLRAFFPWLRPEQPASLPAAVQAPAAALKSPAALEAAAQPADAQFSANLMVARRYGNE